MLPPALVSALVNDPAVSEPALVSAESLSLADAEAVAEESPPHAAAMEEAKVRQRQVRSARRCMARTSASFDRFEAVILRTRFDPPSTRRHAFIL
ncbi:MAG: hypothetical protein JNK45_10310 [Myxococcales bacterium]|nr:hypothetical protein [Myxococcales bacterium]